MSNADGGSNKEIETQPSDFAVLVERWAQKHVCSVFEREGVKRNVLTFATLFVSVTLALFGTKRNV